MATRYGVVVLLIATVYAAGTVLLLDKVSDAGLYSGMVEDLEKRGHTVTPHEIRKKLSLHQYGELLYANAIVLVARTDDNAWKVSFDHLLQFSELGGNLVVAGSESETIRELALQCGIEHDPDHAVLLDYIKTDRKGGKGIVTSKWTTNEAVVSSAANPILFQGQAMAFTQRDPLAFPILTGEATTMSTTTPKKHAKGLLSSGEDAVLVSGFQSRDNRRIVFSGSVSIFSDDAFNAVVEDETGTISTGNRAFVRDVIAWAFQERGVLRLREVTHHKQTAPHALNPESYRIRDAIVYSARLEQLIDGDWTPYEAPDMQLELIMLDPHVRATVPHTQNGVHTLALDLPDQFGVFKFQLRYQRHGLSFIDNTQVVSVRPFRNDEHERFLFCAYPYYASAISMMVGFLLLGGGVLLTK